MSVIRILWRGQLLRRGAVLVIIALLSGLTALMVQVPGAGEHYLYSRWRESAEQVDVIIGYKGSPLQIVASSLYRLENPTGNLSAESAAFWRKHPMVAESCAISLGDNVGGHPVVGVDSNYFSWFQIDFVQGRRPKNPNEIVLSASLASTLGLNLGSEVHTSHGGDERGESHHHHHLEVVGLFSAARSADQTSLFVTNEAFPAMHHSEDQNITSMLLKLKSKSALLMLPGVLDKRSDEQGAFPVFIFAQLQKQWQPTLDQAKVWSGYAALAVAVLFGAFLFFLSSGERVSVGVLSLKRVSSGVVFVGLFGLGAVFAVLGWAAGTLAPALLLGHPVAWTFALAALTPVVLVYGVEWIKLIRRK